MAPGTQPQVYSRSRKAYSALQRQRLTTSCKDYLPDVLHGCPTAINREAVFASPKDANTIKGMFPSTYDIPLVEFGKEHCVPESERRPVKVGVVLSGGQAPGGHNVIAGIFDGIQHWHSGSAMVGFLDGPHGIFSGNFVEITSEIMDGFRNTGGFDMLGSGRHKIESEEQFKDSMTVCQAIGLDGLVVIGGDDSNTNGAVLAEYFKANGCKTKVVGAPKTIDGDLKCPPHLPISFGFDTACKTYAQLVGNVAADALSAQKYYHLVRLMGRAASNIALEVALLTRPNACLLGEEVSSESRSLKDITHDLADMIEERSKHGKQYGVIVLPEGLIEFIPEFDRLMKELNDKLAMPGMEATEEAILGSLSPTNAESFRYLPDFIRVQLLLDRDPHGNVQVSKIETEKLLAATVSAELESRRAKGTFSGSFAPQFHAYGYEGRAGMPTIFDSSYCYALGATAANLLCNGVTGVIASVKNLLAPTAEWQCGGVPITSLCVIERRKGKDKPVIRKALVELDGPMCQPYNAFKKIRAELRLADAYSIPGPTQFDAENCKASLDVPMTLQLELGKSLNPLPVTPPPVKKGKFLYIPQTMESRSEMQQWRIQRQHRRPKELADFRFSSLQVEESGATMCAGEAELSVVQTYFSCIDGPLLAIKASGLLGPPPSAKRVGVVFCGRQAPGCHDLICGLTDMLETEAGGSVLGFVGGTRGLFAKQAIELTPDICKPFRYAGGMELLGRTVDRINSPEDLQQAKETCIQMGLSGLVLVGGARTQTDAAYLAEYLRKEEVDTAVVGVPCGMEGSMINEFVEASLGFDSAAKGMAHLVGNTAIDGSSARKYYYFLKLMDGSTTGGKVPTSHVAVEAALQTRPNMLLLTEEVNARRMTLRDVVREIADTVASRAKDGKHFGTIIVAEGLLAAIPEFHCLISELEAMPHSTKENVLEELTVWSRALFHSLPDFIQQQLLLERQSNAALQLSQLETDRLMACLVEEELKQRTKMGTYSGSFSPVCQFLGYQARCGMPSNFDSDYGYTLGGVAGFLAASCKSGYMAIASDLSRPVEEWHVGGVPFTAMIRADKHMTPQDVDLPKPSIPARPVDLDGAAFRAWQEMRPACAREELYENPGPIQMSGQTADRISATISTRFNYLGGLSTLRGHIDTVSARCRPGCDPRLLRVANQSLSTLLSILGEITDPNSAADLQRQAVTSAGI